jgi:RNA polymerase sigma-70 factor (ECF subfamily)
MSRKPDEVDDLVIRARAGDLDAFEALFRGHQSGVYSFIRSQVREAESAADLTQETFVRAWQSLKRLRAAGAFRGWLYRIASNLVRDHVKSGRHRLEVPQSDVGDGDPPTGTVSRSENLDGAATGAELKHEVWRALAELPAEQRAAVVMHHVEGMSVREIAAAQGVRPGTVMSRLARAREALRERLSEYVEGSDDSV